ncbi:hypothetical protein MXB_3147 [Myxobolus squamalis]|nr:hypothetical protein MXB_3147 [Myxobolus squamalis]
MYIYNFSSTDSSEDKLNRFNSLSEINYSILEHNVKLSKDDVAILSEKISNESPDPNPSPETMSDADKNVEQNKDPNELIEVENLINDIHPTLIPEAVVQIKQDKKAATMAPEISGIPEKVEPLINQSTLKDKNISELQNKPKTCNILDEPNILNKKENGVEMLSLDLKMKMMGKTITVLTDMSRRRRSHSNKSKSPEIQGKKSIELETISHGNKSTLTRTRDTVTNHECLD